MVLQGLCGQRIRDGRLPLASLRTLGPRESSRRRRQSRPHHQFHPCFALF